MTRPKSSWGGNAAKASLILSSAVGLVTVNLSLQGQAQPQPNNQPLERSPLRFKQPDLPDNGAPVGRRRGGTSRNNCPALSAPVTALVPGEDGGEVPDSQSYLGTTIAAYPTFWIYIPPVPPRLSAGEFVLQDKAGNDIYRNSLMLPPASGIMGIRLPSDAPALEPNQQYHWYFKLYCGDPQTQPEYFFVDAWVERVAVAPELVQSEPDRLLGARSRRSSPPQYLAYATHALWYDTLTALIERRRRSSPNDQLQQDWTNLLQSVGLQDLTQEPIVDSPRSEDRGYR